MSLCTTLDTDFYKYSTVVSCWLLDGVAIWEYTVPVLV